MFRRGTTGLQVLLAHPGGPFWAARDQGVWSIPKGEYSAHEDPLAAAQREFFEETGSPAQPPFLPLGWVRLKSGKQVEAWACAGDCDPAQLVSNHFEIEWPPRSGHRQSFPEVDRVEWFTLAQARKKILPAQAVFLDRMQNML